MAELQFCYTMRGSFLLSTENSRVEKTNIPKATKKPLEGAK
jgi:hypothetical protein